MGGQRDVADAPLITEYGFAASLTNFEGLGERLLPVFEKRADGKEFDHGPTRINAKLGGPTKWVDRHHVSERYVDRALQEIKTAQHKNQPFYINLWPDDVHSPVQAPPGMRGDGSPEAHYLGALKELDRQLGRIFDYVRAQSELRDNTLILLASDNGHEPGLGRSGGLRGSKGALYEGGIRSPLIVWGPGCISTSSKPGATNDRTVIAGMDLPPSLLAAAIGTTVDGVKFDGLDMSSALLGESAEARKQPVMWVRPPDRPGTRRARWPDLAIRDGDWKLLVERDGSGAELYDIAKDPKEKNDLAPLKPGIVRRLSAQVIKWDRAVSRNAAAVQRKRVQSPSATGQSEVRRPDIVLFIADDLTWHDIGPYGATDVRTPHLDRLAQESLNFDQAFAASPTCRPSRSSVYTGLYPIRNGAHANHSFVREGPYLLDTTETRKARARYYTDVTKLDSEVGQVRESLARHGHSDALFLFISDQGAQWPFSKWNLYDAGIKVPMIAHWRGKTKVGATHAMVSVVDLLPTLIEVAGGATPEDIDGRSFWKVLTNQSDTHHKEIFAAHTGDTNMNQAPMRCVRTERFKYIQNLAPEIEYTTHVSNGQDSGIYWDS
jgi:arylsulfatase A-like enzyme